MNKSGLSARHALFLSRALARWLRLGLLAAFVLSPALLLAAPRTYHFNQPAEPLADALAAFTQATGIQVAVSGGGAAPAAAVQGDMTADAALAALLAGSGLSHQFISPTLVSITAAASPGNIGTVRVQATAEAAPSSVNTSPTVGANGSSDADATEGTGSYAAPALSVASKTPLSVRETPQSVSVVTHQQIQDQHLTSLTDIMNAAPGVTVVYGINGNSTLQPTYYSRGYAINAFQVDGGAPIAYGANNSIGSSQGNLASNLVPDFDSSEYDRVEIVRGADGNFVGTGDPGGVVSLQRKRPVDGVQLLADASLGSFGQGRLVLDGSTPLFSNDKVRLRTVYTHDDHNFFYDTAYSHQDTIYTNLEIDPVDGTQINIGTDYSYARTLPFYGLPREANGDNLDLPRSTCLCTGWSNANIHSLEYFAELRQKLGANWNFAVNFSALQQSTAATLGYLYGSAYPASDPNSAYSPYLNESREAFEANQYALDATLNGAFGILGHMQTLTLGANHALLNNATADQLGGNGYYFYAGTYDNNPATFTDSEIPPPTAAEFTPNIGGPVKQNQLQEGVYATLRASFWAPMHIIIGERYSIYKTNLETLVPNYASYPAYVLQLEKSGTFDHTLLPPSVAVTLDILPRTTAYVSYTDIYNSQALDLKADGQPLGPETGASYEAGIKRSDFNGTLNSSVALYYSKQNNLAEQDPNAPFPNAYTNAGLSCCFTNLGTNQTSRGVDIEVNGALTPRVQISASYTYNENRFDPGSLPYGTTAPLVSQAPKHLGKLFVTYSLWGTPWLERSQIGFGMHAQSTTYVSGYVYNDVTNQGGDVDFHQGAYAVFDAFAKYNLNQHLSAQLNLTNLLDKVYYQTIGGPNGGSFYGPPRSVLLTLSAAL